MVQGPTLEVDLSDTSLTTDEQSVNLFSTVAVNYIKVPLRFRHASHGHSDRSVALPKTGTYV